MSTTLAPTPRKARKTRDALAELATRCVIYCRISLDVSGEMLGVERQETLCRELAERLGLHVVAVQVDNDLSASTGKRRPGFEQALAMVKAGEVGAIVAYHPDRLYRRLPDLETIVQVVTDNHATIHTCAAGDVDLSTATGRGIARMLGATAQMEVERLGERLAAKNDQLAKSGAAPHGPAPYGFRKTTKPCGYEVEPYEAEQVRYMARRVIEGASLTAIARELEARQVPTCKGMGAWRLTAVRAILRNPANAGLRVHRRKVAGAGLWEPILDRETWESVLMILTDPARKRRKASHKYPLTGLVFTEAGDRMTGATRYTKGEPVREYAAQGERVAMRLRISADVVERVVVGAVLDRTDETALPTPAKPSTPSGEVERLQGELDQLAALRGNEVISMSEWLEARGPIQAKLDAAKAQVGRNASSAPRFARLLSTPGALRKAWHKAPEKGGLTDGEKADVIAALVGRVVVARVGNGGRWGDPADRVEVEWKHGAR